MRTSAVSYERWLPMSIRALQGFSLHDQAAALRRRPATLNSHAGSPYRGLVHGFNARVWFRGTLPAHEPSSRSRRGNEADGRATPKSASSRRRLRFMGARRDRSSGWSLLAGYAALRLTALLPPVSQRECGRARPHIHVPSPSSSRPDNPGDPVQVVLLNVRLQMAHPRQSSPPPFTPGLEVGIPGPDADFRPHGISD